MESYCSNQREMTVFRMKGKPIEQHLNKMFKTTTDKISRVEGTGTEKQKSKDSYIGPLVEYPGEFQSLNSFSSSTMEPTTLPTVKQPRNRPRIHTFCKQTTLISANTVRFVTRKEGDTTEMKPAPATQSQSSLLYLTMLAERLTLAPI